MLGQEVKRASFRFYMNRKEDKEIWDMLRNLESVGYTSMQDFANDAFSCYYNWLLERRVPYLRSEIEADFKEWMREVLATEGIGVVREGQATTGGDLGVAAAKPDDGNIQKEEPEAAIEEDALNRAYDFLSTL